MANWMGVIEGAGKAVNAAMDGFAAKQQAKEDRKQAIADYNFASMQNHDEQLKMKAYQAAAAAGDFSGLSILMQPSGPQGLPQAPTNNIALAAKSASNSIVSSLAPSSNTLNSAADISNTTVSAAENGGAGVVESRPGKDAQTEPTGSTKVVEEVTSKEEGGRLRKRFSVSGFKRKTK